MRQDRRVSCNTIVRRGKKLTAINNNNDDSNDDDDNNDNNNDNNCDNNNDNNDGDNDGDNESDNDANDARETDQIRLAHTCRQLRRFHFQHQIAPLLLQEQSPPNKKKPNPS